MDRPRHPLSNIIPRTKPIYGVVFALDGVFDRSVEQSKITPKSLDIAVIQALQYEQHFVQFGATGHVIDLSSGREVTFDRNLLVNDQQFVTC
jgi:hypothetical protein